MNALKHDKKKYYKKLASLSLQRKKLVTSGSVITNFSSVAVTVYVWDRLICITGQVQPTFTFFSKNRPLADFFIESRCQFVVPFSCNFFAWKKLVWIVTCQRTGVERRPRVHRPRVHLITRVEP